MGIYPLSREKAKSNNLHPHSSSYTMEAATKICSFFLDEENTGKYRLYADKPHSAKDFLKYNITCPKCSSLLRLYDVAESSKKLGLYTCPACDCGKNHQ